MRSNSDYLGFTALFNTDCLFKPRAGMILFYGCAYQITKTLFSLEFYAAFYEGLTTKYYIVLITQDAILTVNRSISTISI